MPIVLGVPPGQQNLGSGVTLVRDLRIGRLWFVTLTDQVGESVGDQLTADEGGVAVARRRPRQFTFTVPVFGAASDPNPYLFGVRMRRQIRAMIENGDYRTQGWYLVFNPDPELNGWMLIGSALISYDTGGVSLGQFKMELDSAFRSANLRQDRPARRVELYDRTLSYIPRDFQGVVFGTDFASLRGTGGGPYLSAGQPAFLPVGITDILGAYRQQQLPYLRAGIDGTGYFVVGLQHGNVVQFEQAEANMHLGDVVVWDRQGLTAPFSSLAQAQTGLVSYWHLDELPGSGDAVDAQSANPGTYQNSPALGQPSLIGSGEGSSVTVNGTSQYVTVPYAASLNPAQFTVSAWVQVAGGSSYRVILASRNAASTGYVLWANASNQWECRIFPANAVVAGGTVDTGIHHVACTYDGTILRLYVDGVQVATGTGTYTQNTTTQTTIGRDSSTSQYFFTGTIDEVAVYNQALTAQQILTLARGGAMPAPPVDPQNNWGWEEVYGPDQPLTASDAVVMANGICRVRYVPAVAGCWAVDLYIPGTGYVEQGRLTVWDSTAQDAWNQHTYPIPVNSGAYASVMEYTEERAAIRIATQRTQLDATCRIDTIISLQRGWNAPRVEAYCSSAAHPQAGVQVRWTPNAQGHLIAAGPGNNYGTGTASPASSSDDVVWPWADSVGPNGGQTTEPWLYVQPVTATASGMGMVLVEIQTASRNPRYSDSAAYGGPPRYSVAASARYGENQSTITTLYGYVSLHLGFNQPSAYGVFAATTYKNSAAGVTSVADGQTDSAQVVQDTQTSNSHNTIATGALSGQLLPFGRYGVAVRVRVASTGAGPADALTVTGGFTGSLIADSTVTRTSSTTYVWLWLGETVHAAPTDTFSLSLWREAGSQPTPKFMLDRVVLVPLERRTANNVTHDGARDLAGLALWDSAAVPETVER